MEKFKNRKTHIDEYYKIDLHQFPEIIDTNSTNIAIVEYNGEWGEVDEITPTDLLLYIENKSAFVFILAYQILTCKVLCFYLLKYLIFQILFFQI